MLLVKPVELEARMVSSVPNDSVPFNYSFTVVLTLLCVNAFLILVQNNFKSRGYLGFEPVTLVMYSLVFEI